jgi:hypothetical protein
MAVRVIIEKFTIGSCALCDKKDERLTNTSGINVCGPCKQDLYDSLDCSRCRVSIGFYCGVAPKDVLCSECYIDIGSSTTKKKRQGGKRSRK